VGAADENLSDVRYKLLNIGLLTAGIGHCLVLQVRGCFLGLTVPHGVATLQLCIITGRIERQNPPFVGSTAMPYVYLAQGLFPVGSQQAHTCGGLCGQYVGCIG
jgi:hypothetical protein